MFQVWFLARTHCKCAWVCPEPPPVAECSLVAARLLHVAHVQEALQQPCPAGSITRIPCVTQVNASERNHVSAVQSLRLAGHQGQQHNVMCAMQAQNTK
jgi:hypothetical protein